MPLLIAKAAMRNTKSVKRLCVDIHLHDAKTHEMVQFLSPPKRAFLWALNKKCSAVRAIY